MTNFNAMNNPKAKNGSDALGISRFALQAKCPFDVYCPQSTATDFDLSADIFALCPQSSEPFKPNMQLVEKVFDFLNTKIFGFDVKRIKFYLNGNLWKSYGATRGYYNTDSNKVDFFKISVSTFLCTSFKLLAGHITHELCHVGTNYFATRHNFDESDTNPIFLKMLEYCSKRLPALCPLESGH